MKYLITGTSGSGKTYLSQALTQKGIPAVDADMILGLGNYYYKGQKTVALPPSADKDFLENHEFLWDKEILKKYLNSHGNTYLFGFAGNVFECLELFDKCFYLYIDDKSMLERLEHAERTNPMGKTKEAQKMIVEYKGFLDTEARSKDLVFINALQTPEEIYREIQSA